MIPEVCIGGAVFEVIVGGSENVRYGGQWVKYEK